MKRIGSTQLVGPIGAATAALVLLQLLVVAGPAHAATVYTVDAAAAPGGTGSSAAPFKSIDACADVATAGDTCQIKSGVYRETITPAQSGSSGSPITFAAAPGATVTVSGADAVGGWSLDSGNIYKVSVQLSAGTSGSGYSSTQNPANTDLWANQVFQNGAALPEAQYPEPGLDVATPAYSKFTAVSGSTLTDPNLPDLGNLAGSVIYFTGGWVAISGTVSSNSTSADTITYSLPSSHASVYPGFGTSSNKAYRVVGKRSLLTKAGEWFYDPAASQLYLWAPDGQQPAGIEAKKRNYAFDLQGVHDVTVKGVSIQSATIRTDAASYNVTLDTIDASYVSQWQTAQYDSTVAYGGIYDINHKRDSGIVLEGHDNVLKNSRISHSMGNGVAVNGYNQTIQDSLITDISYGGTYTSAVSIRGSSHDITIARNTLTGAGRDMINMNTNIVAEQTYKNIRITYNDISDYARLAEDLGGIYTCCNVNMEGSRFDHNWIHDPAQTGNGMHLDNGSYNFASIDHNVIWGLKGVGGANSGGNGINHGGTNGNNSLDLKVNITNNTIVAANASTIFNYYANSGANANQVVKNNILDGKQGSRNFATEGNFVTTNSYNNAAPDPQYVDAAAGDFRLKSGSPAATGGVPVAGITTSPTGSIAMGAYEGGAFTPGCLVAACQESAPLARATSDVSDGPLPLVVQFSSAGSSTSDGSGPTYSWDFGDGDTSTSANPSHTYTTAGNFTATLTVTDGAGRTATASTGIAAGNGRPTASITAPANGGFIATDTQVGVTVRAADPDGSAIDCSRVSLKNRSGQNQNVAFSGVPGTPGDCVGIVAASAANADGDASNLSWTFTATYTDGGFGGAPPLSSTPGASSTILLQPQVKEAENFTSTGRLAGAPASPNAAGVTIKPSEDGGSGFKQISDVNPNDWWAYDPVNLSGTTSITVRAAVTTAAASVEIRSGSVSGPLVTTVPVTSTGGWPTFKEFTASSISTAGLGTAPLYFVVKNTGSTTSQNAMMSVNWIRFGGTGAVGNLAPSADVIAPASGTITATDSAVALTVSIADPDGASVDCAKVSIVNKAGQNQNATFAAVSGQPSHCAGSVTATGANADAGASNLGWSFTAKYTDTGNGAAPALASTPTAASTVVLQPQVKEAENFTSTGRLAGAPASPNAAGVTIKTSEDAGNGFKQVSDVNPNDWWAYDPVNLAGVTSVTIRAAVYNTTASVELRSGSPTGQLVGTIPVTSTGGWGTFKEFTSGSLSTSGLGTAPLYLVVKNVGSNASQNAMMSVNWVRFGL